jgi:ParB family chromosome partitioning protein
MPRRALGRGLDALIPGNTATAVAESPQAMRDLPIDQISPNPHQPRTRFDDDAIRELAASIKSTGVLQPILVRRVAGGYQVVAGERRLRAADLAGLEQIPAIVKDVDDRAMLETALIENVQREDLNPIEEAKAYRALAQDVHLTQDQIAERVGKQRVSISNTLRLLTLPAEIQDMVSRGTMSAGHARALLSLESAADQLGAARYVQAKGFSVRRTEAYVRRRMRRQHSRPVAPRAGPLGEWEIKLQQRFGTHVAITARRKGGEVKFEYYGQEDLERLLEAWGVLP